MGAGESHASAFQIVKYGKVKQVKRLLKKSKGIGLNQRDETGNTMVTLATLYGRQQVLQELVSSGADINIADDRGMTPLHHAIANNMESMAQYLLQQGANVNIPAVNNQTPLFTALQASNDRFAELLIEANADVNAVLRQNGMSPLHYVAEQGNEHLVRILLERGADIDHRPDDSLTAYLRAKQGGHEGVMRLCLESFCKKHGLQRHLKNSTITEGDLGELEHQTGETTKNRSSSRTSEDSINDEKCCKVCWEREAETVLLWCGHVAVCIYCSQFLHLCPICCQPIKKVQRVYLS